MSTLLEPPRVRARVATTAQLAVLRRLHSTSERRQMLEMLEEILAESVGCEEIAVFELAGAPTALRLVHAIGIPPAALTAMQLEDGLVWRCAVAGGMWLDGPWGVSDPSLPRLMACVPLEVGGRGVGSLALFRRSERNAQLESRDIELLDLLRIHLGVALVATRPGAA